MVYCGKPSRGCQMCRTRRIKCDETKPTCMQCQKSRRQCPGYKDDFDLVFRNETKATERRARRTVVSPKRFNHTMSFQDGLARFTSTTDEDDPMGRSQEIIKIELAEYRGLLPKHTLSLPLEEEGPCYFINRFVLSTTLAAPGYFDFLLPMMRAEKPGSQLYTAFSAVTMASLATRPNSRGSPIAHRAIAEYSKALKATNMALQDPAQQKSDQTLASVLMLGFFESIMSERNNALAWGSHIDGAAHLVKMRGRKQLRTKAGLSLFQCVRLQMIKNCLVGSKPPIGDIDLWTADASKDNESIFVTRLCLRVAEHRAEVNNALASFPRTPEYFQKVLNLMRRSQGLEQEYIAWEEALPEAWRARTVAWVDNVPGGDISKATVFPGKVDIFKDIWTAQMWNLARISRLFISGSIVRCAAWICSPVDYRTTPEYATAAKLCVDLVNDIIASVPYHLGWRIGQGGAMKAGHLEDLSPSEEMFTGPKALGGFFCMFPLMSVMCTDYVSDSQRAWAKGRLEFINEFLGLNHAKVLGSFQLRLPSMIIRRDTIVHLPRPTATLAVHHKGNDTTTTHSSSTSNSNATTASDLDTKDPSQSNSPPSSTYSMYPMTTLPHREAIQREQWERDRKQLLKKASNSQGDSVERLLANYLAV